MHKRKLEYWLGKDNCSKFLGVNERIPKVFCSSHVGEGMCHMGHD